MISELRTAGYQKSHKNPASASAAVSRAASAFVCNMVRTASLIVDLLAVFVEAALQAGLRNRIAS